MNRVGFESENVAGEVEGADLPAAVAQDLVGANRAADHLVEILAGIVFAVNLGVALESDRSAGHLEGLAEPVAPPRRLELCRGGSNMPVRIAGNDLGG